MTAWARIFPTTTSVLLMAAGAAAVGLRPAPDMPDTTPLAGAVDRIVIENPRAA